MISIIASRYETQTVDMPLPDLVWQKLKELDRHIPYMTLSGMNSTIDIYVYNLLFVLCPKIFPLLKSVSHSGALLSLG